MRSFPIALSTLLLVSGTSVAEKKPGPWYAKTEHGPAFAQTFGDWFKGEYRANSGLKSILISKSENRDLVALFNTETLGLVSVGTRGVALDNTPWDGKHGQQNKFRNKEDFLFTTASGPAWAGAEGEFTDSREIEGFGNLDYAEFSGYFRNGEDIILDYQVHGRRVLDHVDLSEGSVTRTLEIGPGEQELKTHLSADASSDSFDIVLRGKGGSLTEEGGALFLEIPAAGDTQIITLLYTNNADQPGAEPKELSKLIEGGEGISPETFTVQGELGDPDDAWSVDQIPIPDIVEKEPYHGRIRTSDFDFFADGDRALVSTWDGDIWLLKGLKDFKEITWKRYATGFFEPLGLRIVDEVPYVAGRDAIWKLHDLNGDEEADHFEIFNNDILITNNFHEFQFSLETDSEGNFYTAKASPVRPGGRGFDRILPHNGTVLKISPDGQQTEVIATGLRAPGGIAIGPDGQITTGENEGTWQPCCKLNYHEPSQGMAFFGTEDTRHQAEGEFDEPMLYFPMAVDNSGGGQVWVSEKAKFGLKTGELIHMSYGQSSLYRILPQKLAEGHYQGAAVRIPVKLSSSAQRARFHDDGSLYVCGFRGWQTNAPNAAGIQRIRYNQENPILIPSHFEVTKAGIKVAFETELDEELAEDPSSYQIERWQYVRGPQYGSGQFSVANPDEEAMKAALVKDSKSHRKRDLIEVQSAELLEDGKSVLLKVDSLVPAQQMEINYDLESADGEIMIGAIYHTIHEIPEAK